MRHETSRLHHVAYCVELADLQPTADRMTEILGVRFDSYVRPDLGIHILLAWMEGFELIAPLPEPGSVSARLRAHLDEHGPGVFSVVTVVPDLAAAVTRAEGIGATVVDRQSESNDEMPLVLEEATVVLPLGLPLTLLETNLP